MSSSTERKETGSPGDARQRIVDARTWQRVWRDWANALADDVVEADRQQRLLDSLVPRRPYECLLDAARKAGIAILSPDVPLREALDAIDTARRSGQATLDTEEDDAVFHARDELDRFYWPALTGGTMAAEVRRLEHTQPGFVAHRRARMPLCYLFDTQHNYLYGCLMRSKSVRPPHAPTLSPSELELHSVRQERKRRHEAIMQSDASRLHHELTELVRLTLTTVLEQEGLARRHEAASVLHRAADELRQEDIAWEAPSVADLLEGFTTRTDLDVEELYRYRKAWEQAYVEHAVTRAGLSAYLERAWEDTQRTLEMAPRFLLAGRRGLRDTRTELTEPDAEQLRLGEKLEAVLRQRAQLMHLQDRLRGVAVVAARVEPAARCLELVDREAAAALREQVDQARRTLVAEERALLATLPLDLAEMQHFANERHKYAQIYDLACVWAAALQYVRTHLEELPADATPLLFRWLKEQSQAAVAALQDLALGRWCAYLDDAAHEASLTVDAEGTSRPEWQDLAQRCAAALQTTAVQLARDGAVRQRTLQLRDPTLPSVPAGLCVRLATHRRALDLLRGVDVDGLPPQERERWQCDSQDGAAPQPWPYYIERLAFWTRCFVLAAFYRERPEAEQ